MMMENDYCEQIQVLSKNFGRPGAFEIFNFVCICTKGAHGPGILGPVRFLDFGRARPVCSSNLYCFASLPVSFKIFSLSDVAKRTKW